MTDLKIASVQGWLRGRVSAYCDLSPEQVRPDTALTDLGFSSVYVLTLCGDVEDEFGIYLEPATFADCRFVRDLESVVDRELNAQ